MARQAQTGGRVTALRILNLVAGVGGQHHAPAALPPGNKTDTHCTDEWFGIGVSLGGYGKSSPTGVRNPDRPAPSFFNKRQCRNSTQKTSLAQHADTHRRRRSHSTPTHTGLLPLATSRTQTALDGLHGIFEFLRKTTLLRTFAKLRKATISFVMSVRPSAWNNSAPTGRIFMKFDV
jgi:hypothetical protein